MKNTLLIILLLYLMGCGGNNTPATPYQTLINQLPKNPIECKTSEHNINRQALLSQRCNWLSNYNLFLNISTNDFTINGVTPNQQGIAYELNSTLFTDFSDKKRFVFIPENTAMHYQDTTDFDFPTGSVLVKFFSLSEVNKHKIIEIRLSIKRENGWIYVPYIWDEYAEDAFLYRSGLKVNTQVNVNQETVDFTYEIPSSSNCLECHRSELDTPQLSFNPIGLKARHLNKSTDYRGQHINQLTLWKNLGLLTGLPEDLLSIDSTVNWQDDSADLQDRAKSYLDINCAHCHSDGGGAALSGLRLEYWRKSITHAHGVCNSSHGWRGGGYDIWPGLGEISSIPIRMRHTAAKDRMPPIGRSLVDEEAASLVSAWIDSLPYEDCVP